MRRQCFSMNFLFFVVILIERTTCEDLNQLKVIEFCRNGQWNFCAKHLSEALWNNNSWYDKQLIHLCQIKCWSELRGRLERFQWVWDAKFSCEDKLPGVIGQGRRAQNRHDAMTNAMSKILEKALRDRLMTIDDFLC